MYFWLSNNRIGQVTALGNSSTGSVATFIFVYFLYSFTIRENKLNIFALLLSLFGLFLTGSRTNILLIGITIFIYILYKIIKTRTSTKKDIAIISVSLIFAICLMIYMASHIEIGKFDRFLALFSNGINFGQDDSLLGRMESIKLGIDIISGNRLGISNSLADLMERMNLLGFYSVPHSFIITYYLLWGIGFVFVIIGVFKYLNVAIKKKLRGCVIFISTVFIISFFYGGYLICEKEYFFYILIASYIKIIINETDKDISMEAIND